MKKTISHRFISLFFAFLMLSAFLFTSAVNVQATSIMIESIDNYDEYRDLIRSKDPAYGFVEYKDIQILGEFSGYSYCGNVGEMVHDDVSIFYCNGNIEKYVNHSFFWHLFVAYTLTDKNNFPVSLEITHESSLLHSYQHPHYEKYPLTQPEGMTDMRSLGTEETGFLQRGPLLYRYYKGKLDTIAFELGDTCFHISGNLDAYPMDGKKTIVSQMLSMDEKVAERAYRKLIADIPAQPGYYTPLIVDGIVILCVTAGVCVAAVIITKRTRKRHKAKTIEEAQ